MTYRITALLLKSVEFEERLAHDLSTARFGGIFATLHQLRVIDAWSRLPKPFHKRRIYLGLLTRQRPWTEFIILTLYQRPGVVFRVSNDP